MLLGQFLMLMSCHKVQHYFLTFKNMFALGWLPVFTPNAAPAGASIKLKSATLTEDLYFFFLHDRIACISAI